MSLGLLVVWGFISVVWHQIYITWNPFFPSLLASCAVLGVMFSATTATFFENALSRFLGRISFPLFITHIIVLSSFTSYAYVHLRGNGYSDGLALSGGIAVATIIVAVALAALFEPVERYAIRISRKFAAMFIQA